MKKSHLTDRWDPKFNININVSSDTQPHSPHHTSFQLLQTKLQIDMHSRHRCRYSRLLQQHRYSHLEKWTPNCIAPVDGIYKKAGIDRKYYSKIRSILDYKPSKRTVVALCLSLELSDEETGDMLSAAGFSLSDSERFDLVIQFCLEKKIHDIDDVNQALDSLKLKPL